MADICVVYLSEDEAIVNKLVDLLRGRWDVWWAREIEHGNWERIVRTQIADASAVVAVLSSHATAERAEIIKDEMRFAKDKRRPLFPIRISPVDIPFGFGSHNRTDAYGFIGEADDRGYLSLAQKLERILGDGHSTSGARTRPINMTIGAKVVSLPAFVFSLSSHETQVSPSEGASLLHGLHSETVLVSAYDAWKCYRRDQSFRSTLRSIKASEQLLFLDSGNYEAYRKNDRYYPKRNPGGWRREAFWETARRHSPDLAFSFDTIAPSLASRDQIIDRTVKSCRADEAALQTLGFPLCPIVHLPRRTGPVPAAGDTEIIAAVAAALDPILIAVPERELGDGIVSRARKVRDIRKALDALGKYYPLHLLGTGNPLSMIALAAAGADSFDGLEWCRTVADYEDGFLFHFQHFDLFREASRYRIEDLTTRRIVDDDQLPYTARALSYNVDYFRSATRTLQGMIHSGQVKTLLNAIPNIGMQLFKVLTS